MLVLKALSFFFFAAAFGLLPVTYEVAAQRIPSDGTKAAVETLDDAFRELSDERDALKEEVGRLKAKQQATYDDLKQKIKLVVEEKDEIMKKLADSQQRVASLEEENMILSGKAQDAQYALEKSNELLRDKNLYIEELREEKKQLEMHLDRAESALQNSAARIQKLQSEK